MGLINFVKKYKYSFIISFIIIPMIVSYRNSGTNNGCPTLSDNFHKELYMQVEDQLNSPIFTSGLELFGVEKPNESFFNNVNLKECVNSGYIYSIAQDQISGFSIFNKPGINTPIIIYFGLVQNDLDMEEKIVNFWNQSNGEKIDQTEIMTDTLVIAADGIGLIASIKSEKENYKIIFSLDETNNIKIQEMNKVEK